MTNRANKTSVNPTSILGVKTMYLVCFNHLLLIILLGALYVTKSINAHIDTPCQHLMARNFTPCFNLATGSSVNGSSPTAECCYELNKLSDNDIDCACLIILGTIPAQFTFLRSLQAVLPPSCNVSGVPMKCKGYGTPLPAPGPAMYVPDHSPAAGAPNPTASTEVPATGTGEPKTNSPQIQPVLNPVSNAHLFSEPVAVFTLWYLIAIVTGFWAY